VLHLALLACHYTNNVTVANHVAAKQDKSNPAAQLHGLTGMAAADHLPWIDLPTVHSRYLPTHTGLL
jgi:hypothetical protein